MSSRQTAEKPFIIFLSFVVFLVLLNFAVRLPFLVHAFANLKPHSIKPVGKEFLSLTRGLRGVPAAGYMTCLPSDDPLTDPAVMGPYQQAQFVLAPTLLDYFHPLDHRWLIVECRGQAKLVYQTKRRL